MKVVVSYIFIGLCFACSSVDKKSTYEDDLQFLKDKTPIVELKLENARLIVSPRHQGRVLTSSSQGPTGQSYGWFSRKHFTNGTDTINNVGGEDRLWFGPEYGKFTLFFPPGKEMIGENVRVQSAISTEPYNLIASNNSSVFFEKELQLSNYSEFNFKILLKREIELLSKSAIKTTLDIDFTDGVSSVGFVSKNTMINKNSESWTKETGLLSIWNLGTFPPSDQLIVILPLSSNKGKVTQYWSEVDTSRLKIRNNTAFYKGDAKNLHKIGIPPSDAKSIFGSYDTKTKVLNIIKYSLSSDSSYVNSLWDKNADPYLGDAINVFNDGTTLDGAGPFGPFYELESSSYSSELAAGDSILHEHFTFHFEGEINQLDKICQKTLGISIENISSVFQ
ncbi:MAG: hypothetical protein JXR07_12255 [Reichenbachiella sp.]